MKLWRHFISWLLFPFFVLFMLIYAIVFELNWSKGITVVSKILDMFTEWNDKILMRKI